ATLRVELEPEAPLEAAPAAVRIHVSGAELRADDIHLVAGEVSSAHLGQIARDDISKALAERMVPVMRWTTDGGVVIAPTRLLEPGAHHVVSGSARASREIGVAEADDVPLLRHVWPPEGIGVGEALSVWCGSEPV